MTEPKCCQEMLALISDYLNDDLREEQCAKLENHLLVCENCRTLLGTMKKTIDLYQKRAVNECLPDEVKKRLIKCLELEDLLS